jgi:hypothetical protein
MRASAWSAERKEKPAGKGGLSNITTSKGDFEMFHVAEGPAAGQAVVRDGVTAK